LSTGLIFFSPSKTINPLWKRTSATWSPPLRRIFPPRQETAQLAGTREINKGGLEVRVLRSQAASSEAVDFPCVEQIALLRRHLRNPGPEVVALATSLPAEKLSAAQWLKDNRAAWGIESGLHQRLDVSHNDDLCRVRRPRSMLVIGMFRRFANSLCMHWRSQQKKPHHKTTTDFFTAMNAEHHRYAIRCLHARQTTFLTPS